MDPASAIQLVAAVTDIIKLIYSYGKAVKEARLEIARLRSELFGLKAALEHVAWSIDDDLGKLSISGGSPEYEVNLSEQIKRLPKRRRLDELADQGSIKSFNTNATEDSNLTLVETESLSAESSSLLSPMLKTDETARTFRDAEDLIRELSNSLGSPILSRRGSILQRVSWPFKKSETLRIADHLERIKTYFVLVTTTDSLNICRQTYREICALRRDFEEHFARLPSKNFRQVTKEWLSPCDHEAFQARTIANRYKSTGNWFLDGDFNFWLDRSSKLQRILWLRGKPGSGKSTLFSSCVERLETLATDKPNSTSFAYFYCSATDELSQLPEYVLGSFAAQLCSSQPHHWENFEHYHQTVLRESGSQLKKADLPNLETKLADVCRAIPDVLLLIDGPNESRHCANIMRSLFTLLESSENVRLLVTSTEEADIVRNSVCRVHYISMNMDLVEEDIRQYVEARLAQDTFSHIPVPLKDDVSRELVAKSDGSFRWVSCQVDAILEQRSPKAIRRTLQSVPITLEETYITILSQVPSCDQGTVRSFLEWLTFTLRPLYIDEITEAIVLTRDFPALDPEERLFGIDSVLKYLRSLVRVDRATGFVGFAHESVRTFLTSDAIQDSNASFFYLDRMNCQINVMVKCLDYLSLPTFQQGYCSDEEAERRCKEWPLLMYAALTWTGLLERLLATTDNIVPRNIVPYLKMFFYSGQTNTRGGAFAAWYQLVYPEGDETIWLSHPLYTAAREGLVPLIDIILEWEGPVNLERRGGRALSTPLHVAATYGQSSAVKALLRAGADVNETNSFGECGFNWACLYNRVDIVKEFIAFGADFRRVTEATCGPPVHRIDSESCDLIFGDQNRPISQREQDNERLLGALDEQDTVKPIG